MAKITIEELSDSLKEYLNGLGLTEAQVQELIDKFEDEKIGDMSQLSTEEKGSLVGAINDNKTSIQLALEKSEQAFQRGDEIKTQLVDKLISEGLEVSTDNTFEELISCITLGKRFVTGTIDKVGTSTKNYTYYSGSGTDSLWYITISDLPFIPSCIMVECYTSTMIYSSILVTNDTDMFKNRVVCFSFNNAATGSVSNFMINENVLKDGVYTIPLIGYRGYTARWIAFE